MTKIQIRRDTANNWSLVNPVLLNGEQGYETDTGKMKIGNGSTLWNSLPYFVDPTTSTTDWGTITGTLSNQTDLQTELDNKANTSHTHVEADITDLDKYTTTEVDNLLANKSDITHTHTATEVSYDNTNSGMQATDLQQATDDLRLITRAKNSTSTGVINGGALSQVTSTDIAITDGNGIIIDQVQTPGSADGTFVSWSNLTSVPVTFDANGSGSTYIFITSTGQVAQFTSKPTKQTYITNIYLGVVYYQSNAITGVYSSPYVVDSTSVNLSDIISFYAPNVSGITPIAIGAGDPSSVLEFYITSGDIFKLGSNWHNDRYNPNITAYPGAGTDTDGTLPWNNGAVFDYVLSDGTVFRTGQTILDDTIYDNGTSTPGTVPNGDGLIHFIVIVPGVGVYVQPHTQTYRDWKAANSSVQSAYNQFTPADILSNGIIVGAYIGQSGSSTWERGDRASIVTVGNSGGSSSGGGTSVTEWGTIQGTLSAQSDLQNELDNKVSKITRQDIGGNSYILQAGDELKYIRMVSANPNEIIIPTDESYNFPIGTTFTLRQAGVGQTKISSSATLNVPGTYDFYRQNSTILAKKIGINEWDISGGLDRVIEAPIFSGVIPDYSHVVNEPYIPGSGAGTYFQAGDPPDSYSVNIIPSGMTFDTSTGQFSGTPDTIATYTGVIITATNEGGSTDTNAFTVDITAAPPPAPTFTGTIVDIETKVGEAMIPVDVSSNFTDVETYSLNNAPAWMSINDSGIISGTPDTIATHTNITVTGSNVTGTVDSNAFQVDVIPDTLPGTALTILATSTAGSTITWGYAVDYYNNGTDDYIIQAGLYGVNIWKITSRNAIEYVTSLKEETNIYKIYYGKIGIVGNTLIVGSNDSTYKGYTSFDISNPANPVRKQFKAYSNVTSVVSSRGLSNGNYLYMPENNRLVTIDVTNPSALNIVAEPYGNTYGLAFNADKTVMFGVAGGGDFRIEAWDISNPASPTEISRYTPPNKGSSSSYSSGGLDVSNNIYYMNHNDRIIAIDVSDPSNMVEVGYVIFTPSSTSSNRGGYYDRGVFYITDYEGKKIESYDVTDPTNMVLLDSLIDSTNLPNPQFEMIHFNDVLYASNLSSVRLTAIDITPASAKYKKMMLDLDNDGNPDTKVLNTTQSNSTVTKDIDSINIDLDNDGTADIVIPKK